MKRTILTLALGCVLSLGAMPLWASDTQQNATLHAFKQSLKQGQSSFALPLSSNVSLLLQWTESQNSFSSQGIHTYVGRLQGNAVAFLSIDNKGNAVGSLIYGQGYDIASDNGILMLTPMKRVENECGLHATHAANAPQATGKAWGGVAEGGQNGQQMLPTTRGLQQDGKPIEAPSIADGTYRVFRLAVFLSYNEFSSPKYNKDFNKVKAFWAQLETFLNEIYVRDLGVQFKIVNDERLVEKSYKQAYKYTAGTGLINDAIGTENYDAGLLLDYQAGSGLGGLASLGGIQFAQRKGWVIVLTQSMETMAHELGHLFGANHPFVYSVGLTGNATEPGSGQSVVSYGQSSRTSFISLESLNEMKTPTANAGKNLPTQYPNKANTPPTIHRDKMKTTYRVPQGTFFTLPIYASDAEQSELNYCFNQYGCSPANPATFPVYAPHRSNVLRFGRKYIEGGSMVRHSDNVPVGKYQFWLSVSDALPLDEAIAKHHAPLYDSYVANVEVVAATPFKITSAIDKRYAMGDKLHLTWSVDKTFFPTNSKVRVVMSDDFGKTFRHVLVPSAPNNGACDVYIPQQLMARIPTYSYVVPETGQKIDIWFAGKGVLRLETIDDDVQYYDITSEAADGGGIEVEASKVVFMGVPKALYVAIGDKDALPAKPNITATVDGKSVALTYTETTESNLTTRTWTVVHGGKTSGVQQFIERKQQTEQQKATRITLNASEKTLKVGDEVRLTADIEPKAANNTALQWQVSNDKVLGKISDGHYKALAPGSCRVSVRTLDGSALDAWCDIVVTASTDIQQASAAENVRVAVRNGSILISGLRAQTHVAVYDIDGKLVRSALSNGGETPFDALVKGVYVVTINGKFAKKVQVDN